MNRRFLVGCVFCLLFLVGDPTYGTVSSPDSERAVLTPNRRFETLSSPPWPQGVRSPLREASKQLEGRTIQLAFVRVDAELLREMSEAPEEEPMTRVMRETMGGPVDPTDFIFFLDDVLTEFSTSTVQSPLWLTPSRARRSGIFLHTDDVFRGKPRHYGGGASLALHKPQAQKMQTPALDGDPLGPEWTMRFRNPSIERRRLSALSESPGSGDFAQRVGSLIEQLRAQGARVDLTSTLRSPERGYLMWGAFLISRAQDEESLSVALEKVKRVNEEWGLRVPILWDHPDGSAATQRAAREMAETYQVVFATEAGARSSDHYTGQAVDLVAVNLPRELELIAPDGAIRRFDLSGPAESRDLSLSPDLIAWVEKHFAMEKLVGDYPHWVNVK